MLHLLLYLGVEKTNPSDDVKLGIFSLSGRAIIHVKELQLLLDIRRVDCLSYLTWSDRTPYSRVKWRHLLPPGGQRYRISFWKEVTRCWEARCCETRICATEWWLLCHSWLWDGIISNILAITWDTTALGGCFAVLDSNGSFQEMASFAWWLQRGSG